MEQNMNAVIYIRTSDAKFPNAIEKQMDTCNMLAEKSNYSIKKVFIDEGQSGRTLDRPALKELLEYCKENDDIKAVITANTDRLAKDEDLFISTLKPIFEEKNISIIAENYMGFSLLHLS